MADTQNRQTGKKKGIGLLFVAAAALGLIAFSKKKAADAFNYFIAGIKAVWDGGPVIVLSIGIQNPSNESFTVNSLYGNLVGVSGAKESVIGIVSSSSVLTIDPKSQTIYQVKIKMSISGIATDVYNLLVNGNGISQSIGLRGYINVSGIVFPVNLNYTLL